LGADLIRDSSKKERKACQQELEGRRKKLVGTSHKEGRVCCGHLKTRATWATTGRRKKAVSMPESI
jgi:hypothetical protein